MSRRTTGQLSLGDAGREPVGMVERAAREDVRRLRELGVITTATEALAVAYKRAARDCDRADRSRDVWAATAAMRELRALRLELAPTSTALEGDQLSTLLSEISAVVRTERAV